MAYKYFVNVTINDQVYRALFVYPNTAIQCFDSIVKEPNHEVEGDFIELPAKEGLTVTSASLQRIWVDDPIGQPNHV